MALCPCTRELKRHGEPVATFDGPLRCSRLRAGAQWHARAAFVRCFAARRAAQRHVPSTHREKVGGGPENRRRHGDAHRA
eukprot:935467-Prymnesium_polylepis.1